MNALRLASHPSVALAAAVADGPTTRAAAAAAALVMRDVNAFSDAEMIEIAAEYATNLLSYPKMGQKYQTTDNTIRKYEDSERFVHAFGCVPMHRSVII